MFDDSAGDPGAGQAPAELDHVLPHLAGMVQELARVSVDAPDPVKIDFLRSLEQLKAAAAAAQARVTARFVDSQRAAQREAGVSERRVGAGISAQVGLARRESPARAARYTGWAKVLVTELPHTFGALQRGETTEWRAMIVARETIWLSRADRAAVDRDLAPRIEGLGDRQVEAETRRLAYGLDPHGFLSRSRAAERDRRVSLRPAPDTMARLSALLPAAQGVAAWAALKQAADTARAAGDPRGRGQVMADTLVRRLTGQDSADAVGVEVNLVLTDRTLLNQASPSHGGANHGSASQGSASQGSDPGGSGDEPGYLVGYGPVPAGVARDLVLNAAHAWVRRLQTDPVTGHLVAMDPRRRRFARLVRHALVIRDQYCRTPWCGAPIRHTDHAQSVSEGGDTTFENGQGLCEACNYAKQAHGWTTETGPNGTSDQVIITTPTGHTYPSTPPDLPGRPPVPKPGRAPGHGHRPCRAPRTTRPPRRRVEMIKRRT